MIIPVRENKNPGLPSIKIKSLSELVGAFKMRSSKFITIELRKKAEAPIVKGPLWHRSFHDHIIRSDRALLNIRKYIHENLRRHFNK